MGAPDLLQHLRGAGLVLTVMPDGGLHVAPREALTDDQRVAIRAARDSLVLKLLAESSFRFCAGCCHLLRRGTCGEPVAAGLLTADEGFGIVWPAKEHGAACPAFSGKMPPAAGVANIGDLTTLRPRYLGFKP